VKTDPGEVEIVRNQRQLLATPTSASWGGACIPRGVALKKLKTSLLTRGGVLSSASQPSANCLRDCCRLCDSWNEIITSLQTKSSFFLAGIDSFYLRASLSCETLLPRLSKRAFSLPFRLKKLLSRRTFFVPIYPNPTVLRHSLGGHSVEFVATLVTFDAKLPGKQIAGELRLAENPKRADLC